MKTKGIRYFLVQLSLFLGVLICSTVTVHAEEEAQVNVIQPDPWQNQSQEIKFEVVLPEGKTVKSVEVRPGETGKYINVTSTMAMEISYNSDLFFKIKDTENTTYVANGAVTCFDTTAPTLAAAIKDTQINIIGQDNESGIDKCYVNGTEYQMENEFLTVQLQSFDANYQEFVIQMTDKVGNVSAAYTLSNPYFATGEDGDISGQLPAEGELSEIGDAFGTVMEHSNNTATVNGAATIYEYDDDGNLVVSDSGKDIYEIATPTGKIFYMIVDRSQSTNNAILVSAATEQDLLHFTGSTSEVLPQNATSPTLIPSTDTKATVTYVSKTTSEDGTETVVTTNPTGNKNNETDATGKSGAGVYLLIGMVVVVVGGIGYYLKIYKPKHTYHQSDEDEDDESDNEDNYYSEETV